MPLSQDEPQARNLIRAQINALGEHFSTISTLTERAQTLAEALGGHLRGEKPERVEIIAKAGAIRELLKLADEATAVAIELAA